MPNPSTIEAIQSRLVIIHDTDADGIAAAWCIWRGFKDDYDDVLLIPQRAGVNEIPPNLTENDTVFLVDRSYPVNTLLLLSKSVFAVTVLDHHKSFMTEVVQCDTTFILRYITFNSVYVCLGNLVISVDVTHSACMLAHMYVMEHGIDPDTTINPPWFISYIEDRDIWKWELPNSREINAGLSFRNVTLEYLDSLYSSYSLYELAPDIEKATIQEIGSTVIETKLKIIKSIASGPTVSIAVHVDECFTTGSPPKRVPKEDHITWFAIVCCPFMLISDLGDYMLNTSEWHIDATEVDAVLCYNQDGTTGEYIYSVRSKQDMLWLAKKYGGGGHANACGFKSFKPPTEILK